MRRTTRLTLLSLLMPPIALAACEGVPGHFPGGTHASIDKFVYPSSSELPQTVTVFDTRSGQAIWSKDVPVGSQLVIRFYADKGEDPANPDRMDWQVMDTVMWGGTLNNQVFVPPANARRIETSFRARGEMAPVAAVDEPVSASDALPAPEPVPAPSPDAASPPEASEAPPVEPSTPPAPEPTSDEPAAEPAGEPPVDIPDGM